MSLTDSWKAGKLKKNKNYFVRVAGKKKVYPARLYDDNAFSFCGNGTCYFPNGKQEIKVLAICNYDHFVELTKKVKVLEGDVKTLTNNYKLLESVQAVEIAHGQALVDEFGDYEAVYQEITLLRNEKRQFCRLLKEVKEKIHNEFINQDIVSIDNFHELLTKINKVLK